MSTMLDVWVATSIFLAQSFQLCYLSLEEDQDLKHRTSMSVNHIISLLDFCLGSTYFTFKGRFYEQQEGAAMGSPISPIVANLYMEDLETKAIQSAQDCLSINHRQHNESIHMKKGALQVAARVYNPLGLFSAATLQAKLELQTLWQQKLDWDNELSESEKTRWLEIISDLSTIPSVKIPRYINSKHAWLFHFTDASARAYSANVYLGGSAGIYPVFPSQKLPLSNK